MVSTSPPLPLSPMFLRRCRRTLRTIRRSSRTVTSRSCDSPRGAGQRPHTRERRQASTTLQPLDPQRTSGGCPQDFSSKSHAPSDRDVPSGVSDLFRVPPSRVELSFLVKYRDHEGHFPDRRHVFGRSSCLRDGPAGQQVQLMSTRTRVALGASVASPSPRYWTKALQTDQAFRWLVAKPVPSINGALTIWPIRAVTTRPGAFMRFVLHNSPPQKPITHTSGAVSPRPRPPLQIPTAQIRQSPVRCIWPEDEILNAARWIFQYPRCPWPQADLHPIFHR